MGLMDKITKAFNLDNDDYDYDEDYDIDDDYEEDERPAKVRRFVGRDKDEEVESKPEKAKSNVLTYNKKRKPGSSDSGICVIKPTTMEDGREIADNLLNNKTVFLNLEGLDYEIAQRVVDFASGACYAVDGKLQKISTYIFVVAPSSVDVAGDFPEFLAESGLKLQ